ncbi:hypothetical protein PCA31118_03037 [Pandoraea captiosa]|uniref:Uncharacterized protein n=1 Tax=Pandoraea captiosa TaxID=2508302 RepID=A0A5E5A7J2_9BURK|nr:hypothetical protein [Pandoraea captiosa]VVE68782.1 hypothetical protein PCA31118_03037 [Pandoraea captiosa]
MSHDAPPPARERPILFSAPMVRAILDGSKTQTRRMMKPQTVYGDVCGIFPSWYLPTGPDSGTLWPNGKEQILAMCPCGQPGDRLWVRETWRPQVSHSRGINACDYDDIWVDYVAGGDGQFLSGHDIPAG